MPNFSAELCKLLCRSFSSTPVNFGNFSAVIFAVFYSSVFQAFAKIKKRDASLCPERRVPKPEGTRPFAQIHVWISSNPPVDFAKSSRGFSQVLVENVNYAIKTNYLLNLIDSAPIDIELPRGENVSGKTLPELIKAYKPYVAIIKVY